MKLNRRQAIRTLAAAGGLLAWHPGTAIAGPNYRVGKDASAYPATQRAIAASGEWPSTAINGKKVIIKPNLVGGFSAETGLTTDPEAVRAVVDQALADGAQEIVLVETSPEGAKFEETGYGFFADYDPLGRISLVDLQTVPVSAAPILNGHNFKTLVIADLLQEPNTILISVGKMKTHWESYASLACKNLFGLPDYSTYLVPESSILGGRWALHLRGVRQSIADINRLCPVDFAVIEGIWAGEGAGPIFGTPIRMDTVLAGKNSVAVDRVALEAMGISQTFVRHLAYLAGDGLGPSGIGQITVDGDSLTPKAFQLPVVSPVLDPPLLIPDRLQAGVHEMHSVQVFYEGCLRRVEIVRFTSDLDREPEVLRTLVPFGFRPPGMEVLAWDGRAQDGSLVPPGLYAVCVVAFSLKGSAVGASKTTSWVGVI